MLRRFVSTAVVLLLVAGVISAADKKDVKKPTLGNFVFGKIISLDLKDGTGTLTVLAHKKRDDEGTKMTFKVTKDTKFVKGAGRGKKGTPVDADKVADTFKKDGTVVVQFEGKGDDQTAKMVAVLTPRKRAEK